MNILLIGSGGREHAMAWAITKSKLLTKLYVAPGNAGIAEVCEVVNLNSENHLEVIKFCQDKNIKLVIIGPEVPLVAGLHDSLKQVSILSVGPSKLAAQLEGSKSFTKDICKKYNIPTAKYENFTDPVKAKNYISANSLPIVIKADGLAAGKGVIIAQTKAEAFTTIDEILVNKQFGASASRSIVIEEFLTGPEISFFALSDGTTVLPFGSAQDHKTAYDGDKGPNTGGMGAYSPTPIVDKKLEQQIMETIILPLVDAMKKEGCPYNGIIFAGLMLTKTGPQLIEINVRFGDPETQALMARLESDLLELLLATAKGELANHTIKMNPNAALCVVMAANGYPGEYKKGSLIKNLEATSSIKNVMIFHAGTKKNENGEITANGGRVLGVTATGATIKEAQATAYKAVNNINWPDGFFRKDIGWRAI